MQLNICITVTLKRTYSPLAGLPSDVLPKAGLAHANSEENTPSTFFFSSLLLSALAAEKGCFLEGNLFNCFKYMHSVDCRNGPGRSRAHAPGTRLGPPTHLHDEMQEGRLYESDHMLCLQCWGGVRYLTMSPWWGRDSPCLDNHMRIPLDKLSGYHRNVLWQHTSNSHLWIFILPHRQTHSNCLRHTHSLGGWGVGGGGVGWGGRREGGGELFPPHMTTW